MDIVYFLKKIFKKIEHLHDEDAVIFYGNTGCGKSTMILSLVYGHESLHFTKVNGKR